MLNFTARGSRQRAGFQQNDIMRGQSRTFRNIPPYRGQYLAFVGMVTILPPDLAGNDQLFPRPRIKTKSCDPVEQQAGMTGPGGLLNVSRRIIFATDDNQVLASAGRKPRSPVARQRSADWSAKGRNSSSALRVRLFQYPCIRIGPDSQISPVIPSAQA